MRFQNLFSRLIIEIGDADDLCRRDADLRRFVGQLIPAEREDLLLEPIVARHDHGADRQLELGGELEIPLVMSRHGHDRAGAVTH